MSINERLTPEQISLQRQETRKIIGFAMTLDPIEVVEATQVDESFGYIVRKQADYVSKLFQQRRDWTEHERAVDLLSNGIGDARTIMKHMIDVHPANTPIEQLLAIGRHESTIASVALVAAQTDRQLDLIITHEPARYFELSPDKDALLITADLEADPRHGCPETGPYGQVEPSPLFRNFVPWATELAARSLLTKRTMNLGYELATDSAESTIPLSA